MPGFQFRISDLYRQPKQEELVEDEVYQGFIMLKYQASEKRVKAEQEKARAEKLRADAEQKKARAEKERADRLQADKDRLMALLEQMGIEISWPHSHDLH